MANIDYDRGVLKRWHPSGIEVFMYVNEPGVFLNAYGVEVAPEIAQGAGFDTEALIKEKLKRERLSEAQRMIEQEFNAAGSREVVAEKDGFQVVHIGLGRHQVLDPDGNVLNKSRPLSRDEAEKMLAGFAPAKTKGKG